MAASAPDFLAVAATALMDSGIHLRAVSPEDLPLLAETALAAISRMAGARMELDDEHAKRAPGIESLSRCQHDQYDNAII